VRLGLCDCQRRPTEPALFCALPQSGQCFIRRHRHRQGLGFYDGRFPFHLPRAKNTMPTYHIEMLEGRTVEQKKKLAEAITRVTVEILGGKPESVDILITDVKRENWATGGKLWSEPRD
jgi:4-oxalocrotonate tautomerase